MTLETLKTFLKIFKSASKVISGPADIPTTELLLMLV
jgi:hypothetical protein